MIRSPLLPLIALLAACQPSSDDKNNGVGTDSGGADACAVSPQACDEDGDGYRPSEGDCDDNDSSVNPSAVEVCDGIDNNCDGQVDEGVAGTYYRDFDEDGFGDAGNTTTACEAPPGYVSNGNDCDDAQPRSFPGNPEVCDGIDNNCDGDIDEGVTTTFYADADSDGYGDPTTAAEDCEVPDGYVEDNTDCDDSTAKSYPGNLEVCDTLDNDCDGFVDEDVTTRYYADTDGDGYGDASLYDDACALPTGYSEWDTDCDDSLASVYPGATEYCNGIDDDCDGTTDEADASDATTWYADADADGYGDATVSTVSCYAPAGYVADSTDCDDTRALSNPGALEYCNGYDDDCDGTTDEDDAVDSATWYMDADGDGFGASAYPDQSCSQPAGYVADSTDCDDGDSTSFPGGIEVCDGADNDCNGVIDDAPTDGTTYYADTDGDSFGDPSNTVSECSMPAGYVTNDYDCNDSNSSEPVVADAFGGSSSGSGSASDPYSSLQDAIDNAWECVIALSGTYTESIDLSGKSIDVWGVEGSESTAIDPASSTCNYSNPYDCVSAVTVGSASNASPTIRGFTISGGSGNTSYSTTSQTCADSSASHNGTTDCSVTTFSYCGGGIYVSGDDPVLDDIVIYNNTLPDFDQVSVGSYTQYWLYSYGGGLCVIDGTVTAEGLWVIRNEADTGGGVHLGAGGTLELQHGVIGENDAADGGGISLSGGSLTANNAVVACNDATTDGGGIFAEGSSTVTMENMSFYGNESDTSGSARGADVWIPSTTSMWMINSIVENDTPTNNMYGDGSATLEFNNVYNDDSSGGEYGGAWLGGTGSISLGGNFVKAKCDGNPYNDDWTLDAASGSVDAGNPDPAYNDADGSTNDAGAYGGPEGSW